MPDIPTTVPLVTEQLTARSRDLFGNALTFCTCDDVVKLSEASVIPL